VTRRGGGLLIAVTLRREESRRRKHECWRHVTPVVVAALGSFRRLLIRGVGSISGCAWAPCLSELREKRDLPSENLGPRDLAPYARAASFCFSVDIRLRSMR